MGEVFARSIAGSYRAIALAESLPGIGRFLLQRDISLSWRRPMLTLLGSALVCLLLALLPIPMKVTAPATLEPVGEVQVQAPRNGLVKRLLVDHDQEVKAGTPLAEIWDVELDRNEEQLLGQQSVLERAQYRTTEANRTQYGPQSSQ